MMRKYYLDNIRWGTVLLVLVYHVFYLFNSAGVPGAIGDKAGIRGLDVLLYIVYPWFMALLFLIAGISARYSLQRRSVKSFIGERTAKLLIPSTLGLFVYHWTSGYFNIKIGGGLEFIPTPIRYPAFVVSGIGPLWFIHMLFLFSLLLAAIHALDKKDRLWKLGGRANPAVLLLSAIPLWGAAQLFNMPLITMYRFGIYGASFLLGYFVFSHEAVQASVEKIHIPLLAAAVLLGGLYVFSYFGDDYTQPSCQQSLLTNLYLWAAVLAVLGCGKAWFSHTSPFCAYMAEASYGIYILHYPVVLAVCYLLYNYSRFPAALNYVLALAAEIALTFLLLNIFRRIPVIRYWVLGMKKEAVRKGQRGLPL